MMFLVFFGAALANAFRFTMRMPPRRTLFASFTTMSSAHIVYISPLDNIAMTTPWGFPLTVSPHDSTMAPRVFLFFPWDGATVACPSGLWFLHFEARCRHIGLYISDEL